MVTLFAVSSKHLAILAFNSKHNNITKSNYNMTNVAPAHAGVNFLLGGAMMSCLLITIVCICYLCHWRFQKSEGRYVRRDSWIQVADAETSVHIFTLDEQCYNQLSLCQGRENYINLSPPSYEDVIENGKEHCDETGSVNDPDLPSYETAMKLSGRGYV
ncbi:uncharacterized protein LOC106666848 isoform X2 [Cimex lectularius]|nr:uncharacterized protein LOC106666848 isoform X2 [Cimex lectularius]